MSLPRGADLIRLHEEDGLSYWTIASQFGVAPHTVRARMSEARRAASDIASAAQPLTLPETDATQLSERLDTLRTDYGWISVMHLCDIHFPHHNIAGLEIAYQLLEHVQPAVTVVGSDEADFSIMSKFLPDVDETDAAMDALDEFALYHRTHIERIRRAAPNTTLVYILGNHEKRVFDYVLANAPMLRKTVWRRFSEIVRVGGQVLWLGETDEVRIGSPLLVQHGNRATLNAAKSMLDDAAYQVSIMAGHVHRLTQHYKRGEDYPVSAVTSGCLCNYPAPYHKRKKPTSRWHLGTCIADVNLRSHEVNFNNLEFSVLPDHVSVRFERRSFDVARAEMVAA